MRKLIENQPAWLLHSRPFRDSSLLLDLLTLEHGRISALARGARGPRSRTRALLQPLQPLQVTLAGSGELLSLRQVEARGAALLLSGERLFAALYLNELLVRLLPGHESEAGLFELYAGTLQCLATDRDMEPRLRSFELGLLELLGYGLQFDQESHSSKPVVNEAWYYFAEDGGFVRQLQIDESHSLAVDLYPGHELLRIGMQDFSVASTRGYAKRLLRQALRRHLSERPLTSRELFRRGTGARN
jgi:DNA repair protein RecO (recombination protein O)